MVADVLLLVTRPRKRGHKAAAKAAAYVVPGSTSTVVPVNSTPRTSATIWLASRAAAIAPKVEQREAESIGAAGGRAEPPA